MRLYANRLSVKSAFCASVIWIFVLILHVRSDNAILPINVKDFGAKGNGKTDDTAAILSAISAAQRKHQSVYVPATTACYLYTGSLRLDGITFYGDGDRSKLEAVDPRASALILVGKGPALTDIKITSPQSPGIGRQILPVTGGVVIDGASDFTIRNVSIDTTASVGIISLGGHGQISKPAVIQGCRVANTLADGIHLTDQSAYVEVTDNVVRNSGDDMYAVVSYTRDGGRCHDIKIDHNLGEGQRADGRGISVVGGYSIQIIKNTILHSRGAGIYLDSDLVRDPSGKLVYKMFGDDDIEVTENVLDDVASTVYHGGINLAGRPADLQEATDKDFGDQVIRHVRIVGNVILHAGHSGISMQDYVQDIHLNGNTIKNAAEEGLEIFGGADVLVGDESGNTFDTIGRHGVLVGTNKTLTRPTSGSLIVMNNHFWNTNLDEAAPQPVISVLRQPGLLAKISNNDIRPSPASKVAQPYVQFFSP